MWQVNGHVSNKSYVETREIGVTTRHQTKAGNQECFEKLSLSQLSLSHSLTLDILNNVCFHVYAQKSLIIGENSNDFFDTLISSIALSCEFSISRAQSSNLSQQPDLNPGTHGFQSILFSIINFVDILQHHQMGSWNGGVCWDAGKPSIEHRAGSQLTKQFIFI